MPGITASQIQSVVSADIRAFETAMTKVETRSQQTADKLNQTGANMEARWLQAYRSIQEASTVATAQLVADIRGVAQTRAVSVAQERAEAENLVRAARLRTINEIAQAREAAQERTRIGRQAERDSIAAAREAAQNRTQLIRQTNSAERETQSEARRQATETRRVQRQAENERIAAERRFQRELEMTQAKVEVLNGTDSLAAMRVQFRGLVSEAELAQLERARTEMQGLQTAQREAALERSRAEREAAREAERAAAALTEEEKAARRLAASYEIYNAELAQTKALIATIRPFSADKNALLRHQMPGVSEDELTQLRKLQGVPQAIEDGKEAAMGATKGVASTGANAALGILAMGAVTAKMSSDIEHSLVTIRNNTTMTDADFLNMKKTVLDLGVSTGAEFNDIAEGYMHAANFGYRATDAINLTTVATKAAIATNADAAVTTQLLAKVMRENNIAVGDASKTMNLLWYSAANSDAKMAQFVETGGRVFATAATMGLSLEQTAGAMSIFIARGADASQATMQLQNILMRIVTPSMEVKKRLQELSDHTRVHLVEDFTLAGLRAKGLTGVFGDLRKAAEIAGVPFAQMATTVFPNLRGTLGALIGTSDSGFQGFLERMKDAQRIANGWNPLQEATNRVLETTNNRFQRLANEIKVEFLPVGEKFAALFKESLPVVKAMADMLKTTLDWFLSLPKPIQQVVLGIGVLRLAMMALGNPLAGLLKFGGQLITMWKGVEAAALAASVAEATAGGTGGAGLAGRAATGAVGAAGWLGRIAPVAGGATLAVAGLGATLFGIQHTLEQGIEEGRNQTNPVSHARDAERMAFLSNQIRATEAHMPEMNLQASWGPAMSRQRDETQARLQGMKEELAQLTAYAQQQRPIAQVGTNTPEMIRQMAIAIRTPQGQASCAFFASSLMHGLGESVPGQIGSATTLRDKILATGGHRVPVGQAQPGDYVYYSGPNIGTSHDASGNGHHAAVYMGNGMIADSSGEGAGHQRFRPMPMTNSPEVYRPAAGAHVNPLNPDGSVNDPSPDWYKAMMNRSGRGTHAAKLSPEQKEQKAYAEELAQSQAKLNEILSGGDTVAGKIAAKYHLLSAGVREALAAIKEKIRDAIENQKAEEAFRSELDKTTASIAAGRKGELDGLAKLKDEYPGVSEARLDSLLQQQKLLEGETAERDQNTKLAQSLTNVRSEMLSSTATSELHREAVSETGKSYEQLSEKAKGLVRNLVAVKDSIAANKAVQDLLNKLDESQAKLRMMALPKELREFAQSIGPKNFEKLSYDATPGSKERFDGAFNAFQSGAKADRDIKGKEDADKAYADFHNEMAERIAAADATIAGDKATSAWDKYLLTHKALATALQTDADTAHAMQEAFDKAFAKEQIVSTTAAMRAFNTEMEASVNLSRDILAGKGGGVQGRWDSYLKQHTDMADRFKQDPQAGADAFQKFKQADVLSQQVQGYERMQQLSADLQKRTLELTTGDPFKAWLASLYEIDKVTGQIKLPEGMDMSKLQAIFKQNQMLNLFSQVTEGISGIFGQMFDNIANKGFKGMFQGVLMGFRSFLIRMASELLQSQMMKAMKDMFGGMFGAAPSAGGAVMDGSASALSGGMGGFGGAIPSPMGGGLTGTILGGLTGIAGKIAFPGIGPNMPVPLGGMVPAGAAPGVMFGGDLSDALSQQTSGTALGNLFGNSMPAGNGGFGGFFAGGGTPAPNSFYVAGEHGAELLYSKGNTSVMNSRDTKNYFSSMGSASGGDSHYHFHINLPQGTDVQQFRRSMPAIQADMMRNADRTQKRLR